MESKVAQNPGTCLGWGPRGRPLVLLTQNLSVGGAQRQLVTLASALVRGGRNVVVVVSYADTAMAGALADAGVSVEIVGKGGRWDVGGYLVRLSRVLRRIDPAVVYGFLDVSNLLALFARGLMPGIKVVWGVRASDMDLRRYGFLTRLTFGLAARASTRPDLVIFNSFAGQRFHNRSGYRAKREEVIANGIDTNLFRFNEQAKSKVRASLGIDSHEQVIGFAARVDPMKDHLTFLEAASTFLRQGGKAKFVCVGAGSRDAVTSLKEQATRLGLDSSVCWAGERLDMPDVYSAFDLHTSASAFGEGFSNSIAESMACGIGNVVTDVGDSALVVGDVGVVVQPRDPSALALGWKNLLAVPSTIRSPASRSRITSLFSVERMSAVTEAALDSLFLS